MAKKEKAKKKEEVKAKVEVKESAEGKSNKVLGIEKKPKYGAKE